jgi:predicted RNase H-like HicB family nuclease
VPALEVRSMPFPQDTNDVCRLAVDGWPLNSQPLPLQLRRKQRAPKHTTANGQPSAANIRPYLWYNGAELLVEETELKWRVVLEQDKETGEWAIWAPELPGCVSAGDTEEAALNNIREAIALYLQPDAIEVSPDAIVTEIAA